MILLKARNAKVGNEKRGRSLAEWGKEGRNENEEHCFANINTVHRYTWRKTGDTGGR